MNPWVLVGSGIYVQSRNGVPLRVIRPIHQFREFEGVVITPHAGVAGNTSEHVLGVRETYLDASALFGLTSGHAQA